MRIWIVNLSSVQKDTWKKQMISERIRESIRRFVRRGVDQAPDISLLPPSEAVQRLQLAKGKMLPYLHRFLIHTDQEYDPSSPSHPEQMRARGHEYRKRRNDLQLLRETVAGRMKDDQVRLAAFEGGLIPPDQVPHYFTWELDRVLNEEKALQDWIYSQEDLESNHNI
jgi:hypothetical protein